VTGGIRVDGRDGPRVVGAEEMAGRFHGELIAALPGWKERLHADPDRLVEVEQEVHIAFARGADLLLAGLLATVMTTSKPLSISCGASATSSFYPGNSLTKAKLPRMVAGVCLRIRTLPMGRPNIHSESRKGTGIFCCGRPTRCYTRMWQKEPVLACSICACQGQLV
jgi:hypothetical protein